MPRVARILGVGSVHHVIARFVDRSWQLADDAERDEYLERLACGLRRAGWRLVGYALMSSHVHVLAQASERPLAAWAKPVHVGMAQWLNRRSSRLGPVFAGRPYCEIVDPKAVPIVLAYVHNNPVRARIVRRAIESTWTSHRAYMGVVPAPPGLEAHLGLALGGFTADEAGRADFDAWVEACAAARCEGMSSSNEVSSLFRANRERMGSAVELGTALRNPRGAVFALLSPLGRVPQPPLELGPLEIVGAVAAACGIDLLQPRSHRPRALSRARRAALLVWAQTGRPRSIMARALALSPSAASQLSKSADGDDPRVSALIERVFELLALSQVGRTREQEARREVES